MPFTPAHSAIVLPFLRSRYCSATGLIVGSIAPDFEYFFKLSVSSVHSHTLAGIFYFDIPVVLLLSLVFHLVVKKNLIMNLPIFLQVRFQDTLLLDYRKYLFTHYIVFLISAGVGAASHIFWDSFTHETGFFVQNLPVYDGTVVPYAGARYPLFYALQHLSTVVGLLILTAYIVCKKAQSTALVSRPNILYWVLIVAISLIVVAIRFVIKSSDYIIGNLVVSSITGVCVALILSGFITFKNVSVEAREHG